MRAAPRPGTRPGPAGGVPFPRRSDGIQVVVNGTEMTITELTGRARSLQRTFDRLDMHILDTVETPGRIVIAFLMRGRHVGPFTSPLGTVAPTQRDIEVRTIDVLTVTAGVISAIWAVADDLGLLRQLDAAELA